MTWYYLQLAIMRYQAYLKTLFYYFFYLCPLPTHKTCGSVPLSSDISWQWIAFVCKQFCCYPRLRIIIQINYSEDVTRVHNVLLTENYYVPSVFVWKLLYVVYVLPLRQYKGFAKPCSRWHSQYSSSSKILKRFYTIFYLVLFLPQSRIKAVNCQKLHLGHSYLISK